MSIRRITAMLATFAIVAVLITPMSSLAAAPPGPGVQTVAKGSLEEVLGKLKKMVADNGMMVMGELHQGKVLEMTGLKVQSETVFIGNPTVGKQLFSAEPGAGLVVPVRVNLYTNSRGQTVVSYIPPSQQLGDFSSDQVDMVAKMLDEKLEKLVQMAAK